VGTTLLGLLQTYAACLADEEDEKRARAGVAEAEGADVFAEAAAAVFGEPDQYLMAEEEVMEVGNVHQLAGHDQPVGNAQQGAEGDQQGDAAQVAAMSMEERRLRLDERRLQMEERHWKAELADKKVEREAKERKEKAETEERKAERKLKQQELL